jgi:D-alanine transaminase
VPELASVNGRVSALRAARIPVLDRGFLLADGVYEVLRTYGGRIFELDAHLDRLEASAAGLRLPLPLSRPRLARRLGALVRRSGLREARIYVQVTRGVALRQHSFPAAARPSLVVCVDRLRPPPAAWVERGVAAITVADIRWGRCDLKTIALLPNVLAKQQAVEAGAHEAIFVGPDGSVREGASTNVFVVRRGSVWTPPLGRTLLPGVSRGVILRLARDAGLPVHERRLRRRDLLTADEVLLSSTLQEILPVVRIDGRRIGRGVPGPVGRELRGRFRARTRGGRTRRRES